jgi:8-oxo-dGTP diphosphatase
MIDKLAWVRIEKGRMLCVRSRGKDAWFVPGGKRESGESDEAALLREIREELSVALRADTLQRAGVYEAPAHGKDGAVVRLTCFSGDYDGELRPAAEIEEMAWLTRADRERMSLVTRIVADALL